MRVVEGLERFVRGWGGVAAKGGEVGVEVEQEGGARVIAGEFRVVRRRWRFLRWVGVCIGPGDRVEGVG